MAVVVASTSRPELIAQMTSLMEHQSLRPDLLVFSICEQADLPRNIPKAPWIRIVQGPRGLCAQRNTALEFLGSDYDLVAFYDDDFVPARNSIAQMHRFFSDHPSVAGATGHVLADGIRTQGIALCEALSLLEEHARNEPNPNCIVTDLVGLYGCNMVYRIAAIGRHRFDERLKLYAWQEDIDFAASIRHRGRIVKTFAFCGVHQGVKHGRTPGFRLGYSQVINPSYLAAKGTMPTMSALRLIVRNVLANHLKMWRPEPWIDRRGRVRGNWLGALDLLRGRLTPERIETL
ncbi:glycosyltransferase family 2 protein [Novosphingobium profundi]|nr:glycosyltransferase family 2 protein [Novosphingobium profundi]